MTQFRNNALNPEFKLRDAASLKGLFEADKTQTNLVENLDQEKYGQFVGPMAFGGLPDDFESACAKIDWLETLVRETYALPSKRPGGARSKGTGFIMPPTFKAYKSTVKRAYEHGVELLDADGIPRPRNAVETDIKAACDAAADDKRDEEKLSPMTDSWVTVFDRCDVTDPLTVDCVNRIVNAIKARGMI